MNFISYFSIFSPSLLKRNNFKQVVKSKPYTVSLPTLHLIFIIIVINLKDVIEYLLKKYLNYFPCLFGVINKFIIYCGVEHNLLCIYQFSIVFSLANILSIRLLEPSIFFNLNFIHIQNICDDYYSTVFHLSFTILFFSYSLLSACYLFFLVRPHSFSLCFISLADRLRRRIVPTVLSHSSRLVSDTLLS